MILKIKLLYYKLFVIQNMLMCYVHEECKLSLYVVRKCSDLIKLYIVLQVVLFSLSLFRYIFIISEGKQIAYEAMDRKVRERSDLIMQKLKCGNSQL